MSATSFSSPSDLNEQHTSNIEVAAEIQPIFPSKSTVEVEEHKSESVLSPAETLTLAQRRSYNNPASLVVTSNSSKNNALEAALVGSHQQHKEENQEILIRQILEKLDPKHKATDKKEGEEWMQGFIENPLDVKKRLQLLLNNKEKIPKDVCGTIWKALVQPSLKSQILYETLVHEKSAFEEMIERDHKDNEALKRVLKAYSVYDGRVGYHPKLATLISPILDTKMPENEVYSIFVRLMETYDMRQLYMLNMEGLELLLQQFQSLFTSILPNLASHFAQLSIQPAMYASNWFMTCFTTTVTDVERLYDLVFLQGAFETMTRVAIHILKSNEQQLLQMDQQQSILNLLAQEQDLNVDEILDLSGFVLNLQLQPAPKPAPSQNSSNKQLEELSKALAQLEKEYTTLKQDNMTLKMHEMDQEAAQLKLAKRNTVLEKRVKKYKVKLLANVSVASTVAAVKEEDEEQKVQQQQQKIKKEDHFSSFVESLRDTGDFGALIAGALAPAKEEEQEEEIESLEVATATASTSETTTTDEDQKKLDAALQNVTSELVAVKLDHFETCQRYESLSRHCQDLAHQFATLQQSHTALSQKVIYLESELEDVSMERDQIYQDQEEVLEMAMVAKKTSAELQLEKLELVKQVNKLESQVKGLQQEKQAYFMPRDSFSEEVFAAHTILFGSSSDKKQQKSTVATEENKDNNEETEEYKQKFVESELRCRELEKYLAETKVKLAELESGGQSSHRVSLQVQQQRRTSYHQKRSSTASSLSMLATRMERRSSIESYASSTTSFTSLTSNSQANGGSSKRSSMYSRIWNAFGSPPGTPTTTGLPITANGSTVMVKNNMIICEEPQIIQ